MKAVIHFLYKNQDKSTLFYNKNASDYSVKDFLITNDRGLNKGLFKQFEQIFYFNGELNIVDSTTSVLVFLKQMGYTSVCIKDSKTKQDGLEFKSIEELISHFSVVNDILKV